VPYLLHFAAFVAGALIVFATLRSGVRTFVLPRSARDALSRLFFEVVRSLFDLRTRRVRSYAERDAVMALYAPVALLVLPGFWITLVLVGYTAMFWAIGVQPLRLALELSGSSLLTLGFVPPHTLLASLLAFSEAGLGLTIVALFIGYLPTMYAAFSRRETQVRRLEVRAGSPPSASTIVRRYHALHGLDRLREMWAEWEIWFVEVEETHTSLAALTFFRSPHPDRSWVTAAGAVLDAAAITLSTVDTPRTVEAEMCLEAGSVTLRRIGEFFRIPFYPNRAKDTPISIAPDEFDAIYDEFVAAGVPVVASRVAAWEAFAARRALYDNPLLALASLTMAPYAPWSSDRSLRQRVERRGSEADGRRAVGGRAGGGTSARKD
jgi:hypothetical protein